MTYGSLQNTIRGLLTGDNKLPSDQLVLVNLLGMAYNSVVTRVTPLRLLTQNKDADILRLDIEDGWYVRVPRLPNVTSSSSTNTDAYDLDLDTELCYVVARLMASYISMNKVKHHEQVADRMLLDYKAKVAELRVVMKEKRRCNK